MDNLTMVLLGATGNLAKLKIYPALMELAENGFIDDSFNLIGVAEDDFSYEDYRSYIKSSAGSYFNFPNQYVKLDIQNDSFQKLIDLIEEDSNIIFYLSIPPSLFQETTEKILSLSGINRDKIKVVIEKPYGIDYQDTVNLNKLICENNFEKQVYRVDHYLEKSGIDRLSELKNSNLERWNNKYIDEITIAIAETLGIEDRIDFYKETGAIADVVQNHIFQLLLRVISNEKNREEYISHILDNVDDKNNFFKSKKYLDFEKETMFYCKIYINSDIWKNVGFNIVTGKRMSQKKAIIEVKWKDNTKSIVDFQDDENFALSEYAVLIKDCIKGNNSKFVSSKEAEATWVFGSKIRQMLGDNIEMYEEDKISLDDVLLWIKYKR